MFLVVCWKFSLKLLLFFLIRHNVQKILDEAAILKAKEEAENAFHDKSDAIDYAKARASLAETAAQLQTIQRLRKRAGR